MSHGYTFEIDNGTDAGGLDEAPKTDRAGGGGRGFSAVKYLLFLFQASATEFLHYYTNF